MTGLVASLLGPLLPYLILGGAALAALLGFGHKKRKQGIAEEQAKEARRRAENLERLKKAADAAAAVRPGDGGELSDPNNRDNWRS